MYFQHDWVCWAYITLEPETLITFFGGKKKFIEFWIVKNNNLVNDYLHFSYNFLMKMFELGFWDDVVIYLYEYLKYGIHNIYSYNKQLYLYIYICVC